MIFAMGTQELRLEINPWELLYERNKLFPSFIQEPANENWICSPLDSFTRINSSHFPASMKYGQIENFPVAPSNTAWLENPPMFLSKEFNLSLSLMFASCFPFLTLSRGHLMKHQSKHSHHLTPSAVAKSFSSKASAQVKMSILEIWIRELWREPFPFTAHRKNLGRLASKLVRPRFAFISVTLKGKKLLKMILSFLSKPRKFGKLWSNIQKAL